MILFRQIYRHHTDEQLMGLLQQGKTSSFNELYRRYSRRLLNYFYRMLNGDEEKAQDFLQNICLIIIEKAVTFNIERKFSSWVFTIAGNMCKNEYRRMGKRISLDNEIINQNYSGPEKPLDEVLDHKIFNEHLYRELYKLDYDKRSVFLLRFQEQYTIKEISHIVGCAEGTVKSRLFYTVKLLSEKLHQFRSS